MDNKVSYKTLLNSDPSLSYFLPVQQYFSTLYLNHTNTSFDNIKLFYV